MKKSLKRSAILVISVLMVLALLAGCTSDELAFYNLNKEVANLDYYQDNSTTTLKVDVKSLIPAEEYAKMTKEDKALLDSLTNISLDCSTKADMKNYAYEATYSINMNDKKMDLGKMIFIDGKFYLENEKMLGFFSQWLSENDNKKLKAAFGDNQWLKVDFAQLMSNMTGAPTDANFMANAAKIIDPTLAFTDKLMMDVYKDYNPNIVAKDGNGYTLKISDKDFAQFSIGLMKASVMNVGSLMDAVIEFYSHPDIVAYYKSCGLAQEDINMMVATLKESKANMTQANKDEALKSLDDPQFIKDLNQVLAIAKGSYIQYDIAKNGKNYNLDMDIALQIQMPDTGKLAISLNTKESVEPIAAVTITAPEKSIDAMKALEENLSYNRVAILSAKNAAATDEYICEKVLDLDNMPGVLNSKAGQLDVKVVNNKTYLPLRLTGEALNADINWDAKTKKAIVKYGTFKGSVDGLSFNGKIYVPIRQFEQLGFKVQYDNKVSYDKHTNYLVKANNEPQAYGFIVVIQPK